MTNDDLQKIVSAVIDELLDKKIIIFNRNALYAQVGTALKNHFINSDPAVSTVLDQLRDEKYYNILELYYRDGLTCEQIAERLNVDVSTVARQKKKLCFKFYMLKIK